MPEAIIGQSDLSFITLVGCDLPNGAFRALMGLWSFRNRTTGRCHPKLSTLAERLGIPRRTVQRWMAQLRASGTITATRHRYCCSYEFHVGAQRKGPRCATSAAGDEMAESRCATLATGTFGTSAVSRETESRCATPSTVMNSTCATQERMPAESGRPNGMGKHQSDLTPRASAPASNGASGDTACANSGASGRAYSGASGRPHPSYEPIKGNRTARSRGFSPPNKKTFNNTSPRKSMQQETLEAYYRQERAKYGTHS